MPNDNVVHVIDDDSAMRQSLEFLLRSANVKARTYESADAFLECLPNVEPGCIVTDVRMPGLSGLDLLRRLNDGGKKMPVIVITGHGDVPLAVEAMKRGAADFIEKPFDDEVLLTAIRSALRDQTGTVTQDAATTAIQGRLASLSLRERQVLDGLVAGHQNKTIAFELGISPRTVEIYRANVMTKMEAGSLSELVRMAIAGGLLSVPTPALDSR
jgi:two-component system, LuxR family, response regulator FixJ